MNNSNFLEDSDSSDEDYIPGNGPVEVVSEVDSEGDSEDLLSDADVNTRRKKTRKKNSKTKKKIKTENDKNKNITEEKAPSEEEKKKYADDLWANFKKETGFKSKTSKHETAINKTVTESTAENKKSLKLQDKLKITEIFEFAGEEVKVEKEVDNNSKQARLFNKASNSNEPVQGRKRTGFGIASVLSHLGKRQKINTLEKSKLDWEKFKKEENLEEELRNFNKGKDGYLEKQDFLQRADLRRFEIEKEIRTIERNKRMNDV